MPPARLRLWRAFPGWVSGGQRPLHFRGLHARRLSRPHAALPSCHRRAGRICRRRARPGTRRDRLFRPLPDARRGRFRRLAHGPRRTAALRRHGACGARAGRAVSRAARLGMRLHRRLRGLGSKNSRAWLRGITSSAASTTSRPAGAVDDPQWIGKFTTSETATGEIWAAYWEAYERCIASGLFDFVAHPDLVKKFGHRPPGDLQRYYEPAIAAAAVGNVAVEVSTAGLRKPVGELYPAARILSGGARGRGGGGHQLRRARAGGSWAGFREGHRGRARGRLHGNGPFCRTPTTDGAARLRMRD